MQDWIINFRPRDSKNFDDSKFSVINSNKIAVAEFKDAINVKFILCHEGANLNRDGFLAEELQKSYKTIVNKPITWEHGVRSPIGVITNSYLLDPSNKSEYNKQVETLGVEDLVKNENRIFILCEGTIWKDRYPEESLYMLDSYAGDSLFFSMENRFKYVQCSKCGKTFEDLPYCDCLTNRSLDNGAIRYFRDMSFRGAGKVDDPGDPGARALSFAGRNTINEFMDVLDKNELFENEQSRKELLYHIENHMYYNDKCPCESIADYPDDYDSEVEPLIWLYVCKEKNPSLFKETIGALKGEKMKQYTQEEVDKLVKDSIDSEVKKAIASYEEKNKFDEQIKTLKDNEAKNTNRITELENANAGLTAAKEDIEKQYKEYKENVEKNEMIANRIKTLENEKLSFDLEKMKTAVSKMDEETFNMFKETLIASAGVEDDKKNDKKNDKKDEDEKNELENASRNDLENINGDEDETHEEEASDKNFQKDLELLINAIA